MNAGVGLISFPNTTSDETVGNNKVLVDNIINLVRADFDGANDDSLACPWQEIGQESIVLAYQQLETQIRLENSSTEKYLHKLLITTVHPIIYGPYK